VEDYLSAWVFFPDIYQLVGLVFINDINKNPSKTGKLGSNE
jgi:hypothetical protein